MDIPDFSRLTLDEVAVALGWGRHGLSIVTPDGLKLRDREMPNFKDDLNALVAECARRNLDWMLGSTNDGLTIHAEVGGRGEDFMMFGDSAAEAMCCSLLRFVSAD